jgi:hypothetical protein
MFNCLNRTREKWMLRVISATRYGHKGKWKKC